MEMYILPGSVPSPSPLWSIPRGDPSYRGNSSLLLDRGLRYVLLCCCSDLLLFSYCTSHSVTPVAARGDVLPLT